MAPEDRENKEHEKRDGGGWICLHMEAGIRVSEGDEWRYELLFVADGKNYTLNINVCVFVLLPS